MDINPYFELNSASKNESSKIVSSTKTILSINEYIELSIEENKVEKRLLMVSIIISE
jgi:hypothetical protein